MSLASEYRKKKEEEKKLSSIPTEETAAPSDAQISSDTTEPTATEKEEPKTTYELLGILKYPLIWCPDKMVEISRPEKDNLRTYGFSDGNGLKHIALTATKEQWATWFKEALSKL
mgnify:CR=1 FL=1